MNHRLRSWSHSRGNWKRTKEDFFFFPSLDHKMLVKARLLKKKPKKNLVCSKLRQRHVGVDDGGVVGAQGEEGLHLSKGKGGGGGKGGEGEV